MGHSLATVSHTGWQLKRLYRCHSRLFNFFLHPLSSMQPVVSSPGSHLIVKWLTVEVLGCNRQKCQETHLNGDNMEYAIGRGSVLVVLWVYAYLTHLPWGLVISSAWVPSCRKCWHKWADANSENYAAAETFIWLHKIKELDSVGLAHTQQQIKILLYRIHGPQMNNLFGYFPGFSFLCLSIQDI